MLLLVVEPELDECGGIGIVWARLKQVANGIVDTGAIVMDLCHRRAAQDAAFGPRMHGADGVVIGIEQTLIAVVDDLIARL
jgi:hypothetical protein